MSLSAKLGETAKPHPKSMKKRYTPPFNINLSAKRYARSINDNRKLKGRTAMPLQSDGMKRLNP
jgi:hypothetical protein